MTERSNAEAANGNGLERRLGGVQATLLVVGSVVGTGILAAPALVASCTDNMFGALLVWVLGGLYALTGALSQAKLAVLYPRAGGDYVYLRESFGPLTAFMSGWISLTVGFAGSQAVMAKACSQYFMEVFPSTHSTLLMENLLAITIIVVFTAINLGGVSKGAWLQSLLTAAKVLGLVILAGAALAFAGEPAATSPASLPAWGAILVVVFTYAGWNDSIYVAGEVKNPRRNLPLSLIGGTLIVTGLYVAFNFVYIYTTGGEGGGEKLTAAAGMVEAVFGGGASRVVSLLAALLILGTVSAMVVTGPRIAYAMALDKAIPSGLARLNPRGVPASALLLQGALSIFFVYIGTLRQLFEWVGLAIVLFSALATACVFVEQRRNPTSSDYKIPLYPLPPLLYIGASLAIAAYVAVADPRSMLAVVLFVVAGLPVYYYSMRSARKG